MIPQGRLSSCCLHQRLLLQTKNKLQSTDWSKASSHVSFAPWPLNNTSSRGVLPAFTPARQGGMYTALQAKDYTWRSGHKTQLQESRCEATVPLCFSVDIGDHLPRLLSPCNGLGVSWCRTLLQRQSPDGCGMEKRLSCFPN